MATGWLQSGRWACHFCQVNLMDYMIAPVVEGSYTGEWFLICNSCVAEKVEDILDDTMAKLTDFAWPVRFLRQWDSMYETTLLCQKVF